MSDHCFDVALVVLVRPMPQVSGGDDRVGIVRRDLVAGELFRHEAVVRLVVNETADDVVAIAPGVRPVGVLLEAIGLGVADEVEPLPRHALAVTRAGEQAVDQLFVCVGRLIGDERIDFGRRRRKAVKVERGAANQRDSIGFARG